MFIYINSFVIIHVARLQLSKALACDKSQRSTLVPSYRYDRIDIYHLYTYVYYILLLFSKFLLVTQ